MNQTQMPFPRRELAPAQHQQLREMLVREAAPQPIRRFVRPKVLVPLVSVLAVGAAVAGAGAITQDWNPVTAVPAAAQKLPDLFADHSKECGYAQRADVSRGDGLRYVAALPAGWKYHTWLNEEPYCPPMDSTDPVVTFVKETTGRQVASAVTVWRSLPPEVSPDSDDATSTDLKPAKEPRPSGTSMAVTVRGRPARLIGLNQLTWTEPDGQRWSLTAAGLSPAQLQEIAEGLRLEGRAVEWPATEAGYTEYPIATRPAPKEFSPQGTWYITAGPSDATAGPLSVDVTRAGVPWQVALTTTDALPAEMVDVNGRPGLLTPDRDDYGYDYLGTDTADGAQVKVQGAVPAPSTLVDVAAGLRPVAADDPAIHLPDGS